MMGLPESIHFIERGWVNSNQIIVAGGDGPVLVDTGYEADTAVTLDAIAQTGIKPANITRIINTHCHWDHIGGNRAVQEASGAKILAGPKTAEIINTGDRNAMWLDYFGAKVDPPPVDEVLRPGHDIVLGDLKFQILAVPGHAPDGIALFNQKHGLLIGGDVIFQDGDMGILNTAVHGFGIIDQAMDTVKMLQKMNISTILPGHGPIIYDAHSALIQLWRRLTAFLRDPAKMAWHLVRRIIMNYLIIGSGQPRDDLVATMTSYPWAKDYVFRCGYIEPEELVNAVIDDFLARGLIESKNGRLISHVPR